MAKNRNYHCKDVEMLLASKTIAESFRNNIGELSVTRTSWTSQYANELIARIDGAIANSLGIDARKDLRGATASLLALQAPAKRDVSFFKLQITEDFKKEPARRNEILRLLGFSNYTGKLSNANQEALVKMLYDFKTNMTDALRGEITGKGMNPVLITNILGYAENYQQANVTQETLKGSAKIITDDLVDAFNEIHGEIMSICKIAAAYYRDEPARKQLFSFSRVLANMGVGRKSSAPETVPEQVV